MCRFLYAFLIVFITLSACTSAQDNYDAPWVSYPTASVIDYGVYHFRKAFTLDETPENLIFHISADNRYNLFVNGERVCYGPAKGDFETYKYDVINIAPWLRDGENLLAAEVVNFGKDKPMSFLSAQTAFFVKSADEEFAYLDTDASWKTLKNTAYDPVTYNELMNPRWFYGYYACGPGDEVFADKYPWGWESLDYDDSGWTNAEVLTFDRVTPWNLVPRNIAFMDSYIEYPAAVRIADGAEVSEGFLTGDAPFTVPANTEAVVLLDYELLTMGYPELTVAGGAESRIQVRYAEALYEEVNLKGHRDSVNNLTMFGVWDTFHPDGPERTFRPLWKRTARYVQFEISTAGEPLTVLSYKNEYSGYPYPEMATFESDDPRLDEIFEMCLQTFRMCSGETYYDTPFYEQLSYGGDNRPIAAVSMYNSVDDRLFREVMRLYPQSENRETSLFKSAYPSRFDFDMGTWSMAWVQTLRDYYYMRGDGEWVKQFVDNVERVLWFYERHIDESLGILGTVRGNNFVDWSITKGALVRRNDNKEIIHSALLTIYYVHTLDTVIDLYRQLGLDEKADYWSELNGWLKDSIRDVAWDEEKQLFTDYPDSVYSQHTNVFAILTDIVPEEEQAEHLRRILDYEEFDEYASSYFSFFLFKAMQKTNQEDLFLENLDFWHNYIERGHTTCGETGFASHDRSDCHAWSSHPAYFLLSSVAGIKPADIGFNTVEITPHLGPLKDVNVSMPHPDGRIKADYTVEDGTLTAVITLPDGMTGTFIYNEKSFPLTGGENTIKQ